MGKQNQPPAGASQGGAGQTEVMGAGADAGAGTGDQGAAAAATTERQTPNPGEDLAAKLAEANLRISGLQGDLQRATKDLREAESARDKANRDGDQLRVMLRAAQKKSLELRRGFIELTESVSVVRADTGATVDARAGDVLSELDADDVRREQERLGVTRKVIPVDHATFAEVQKRGLVAA